MMTYELLRKRFSPQGTPVSLEALLAAREARALRQRRLLTEYRQPLLSVTLTAVGAVKKSPLLDYVFAECLSKLTACFERLNLTPVAQELGEAETGHEALFVLPVEARTLKTAMIGLEESVPLARLWDLDVFDGEGRQFSRTELGFPPRPCLLCADEAKACARSRRHRIEAVLDEMQQRAAAHFIAERIDQAILTEVRLTPKPGLVDRANNGAHRDMDLATFERSAAALKPYWAAFVRQGMKLAGQTCPQVFSRIRPLGLQAEKAMLQATDGVNTHKGAIFAFGLIAAAIGRWWAKGGQTSGHFSAEICKIASSFVRGISRELQKNDENQPLTAGVNLYRRYGLTGARGEAERGFLQARQVLPLLFDSAQDLEHRLLLALLHLMADNDDTNLAHRGGLEGLRWVQRQAKTLLTDQAVWAEKPLLIAKLTEFDTACIKRNLSAGGSADLLALSYFFYLFDSFKSSMR